MKRIRFSLNRSLPPTTPDGSPAVLYGLLDGETVHEGDQSGKARALGDVRLLPPSSPTKIVCVGRNYREHAAELGNEVPTEPLIFLKPPSSLLGHGDDIVYPPLSKRVDYEGEVAIIIGRRATRVNREAANEYILGYTCLNDVTARDLQKADNQWTRAKGFDTFCPVGPWMVPRDEVAVDDIVVRTFVDGVKKQEASIGDMVFPIGVLIEYITQVMTLEPGDLIATGTPSGIGPLEPGSVVRVEVAGVGAVENRVVRP